MSNKQNLDAKFLERWAAAYTLARSIPADNRFHMGHWANHNEDSECGTSACLAGHAILHPWFMERGFFLREENFFRNYRGEVTAIELLNRAGIDNAAFWGMRYMLDSPFDPDYCGDVLGLEAFENEDDEVTEIDDQITPTDVAAVVLDWMINHWGKEATDAAIAASTVRYSVDEVHKNAPWNQGAQA